MSSNIDLKSLKQKIYLSYHRDGLIDIIIGFGILGFGLLMATGNSAFLFLIWIWFLLYTPLKGRITFPRLGYVKFDEERTIRTRLILMIVIGVMVFILLIGLYVFVRFDAMSSALSAWLRRYHMLVLGTPLALVLVGVALWSGVKRLFIYAGLIMLVIVAGIQLGIQPPGYVMVLGGLILLSGIGILLRFLRKYPVVDGKETYGR